MGSLRVIQPGIQTTLEDDGRWGYQRYGVSVGGMMDDFAGRTANLLVGNRVSEAVLEMTLSGPELVAETALVIAVCGADMHAEVNGQPMPLWRPFRVESGSVLRFGYAEMGCRAYLAVGGGFKVPTVMGSKSTDLRAEFGGMNGRVLREGDRLDTGNPRPHWEERLPWDPPVSWFVSTAIFPHYQPNPVVRAFPGAESGFFSDETRTFFFNQEFTVGLQSNRMGYRLEGSAPIRSEGEEMVSESVTAGTVQCPPGGQPIVLMADRQTTGGYPRIAQVAAVDLPVLAQTKPGETVTFEEIDTLEAERLFLERERDLAMLAQGIAVRLR